VIGIMRVGLNALRICSAMVYPLVGIVRKSRRS
jgi:hypothetical protein